MQCSESVVLFQVEVEVVVTIELVAMKLRVKFWLTLVDELGESGDFTCQTEEDGKSFCCARVNDYRKERKRKNKQCHDSIRLDALCAQTEGVVGKAGAITGTREALALFKSSSTVSESVNR